MASRRTVFIHDKKRNSTARKQTHRKDMERQQQQAAVLQKLLVQARAEAKSA